MTEDHDQPELTPWERYLLQKEIAEEAARRAREAREERLEQEPEDEKARSEAKFDRAEDLAYSRAIREAEIEFERMERERRGIDAESERRAFAKERRDAAAEARDEALASAEADRAEAITNAAQQAVETLKEHAEEFAVRNDVTSAEYRALAETRAETVSRIQEYRTEREIEETKAEEERRAAAASMALQARETRLLREQEDNEQPTETPADRSDIRALAALLGGKPGEKTAAIEKPPKERAIDAVRRELASISDADEGESIDSARDLIPERAPEQPTPVEAEPDGQSGGSDLLQRLLSKFRRAA